MVLHMCSLPVQNVTCPTPIFHSMNLHGGVLHSVLTANARVCVIANINYIHRRMRGIWKSNESQTKSDHLCTGTTIYVPIEGTLS